MTQNYDFSHWYNAKGIFLAFLLMFCTQSVYGQVVSIGNGTVINKSIPVEPHYGYTYSQNIYLASEINNTGEIYKLTFKAKPGSSLLNSNDWTIYMGHTDKEVFGSNTDWIAVSELTQVYTGEVSLLGDVVTIELSTPFNYNGTDNLIVAVDENASGYGAGTSDFYASSVTGNRSIYYKSDNTNPDPNNPPQEASTTLKIQAFIANIDLDFTTITCSSPSALIANNVTSQSANLNWTAGGSEAMWNVEYGEAGFEQGSGTEVLVTSNAYSLSSLSSNTSYEFYVQANCGSTEGLSPWVGPFQFKTLCTPYSSVYCEDFESAEIGSGTNSTVPNCWSFFNSGTGEGYVASDSNASSGAKYFSLYNSGNTTGNYMLVSPATTILSDGNHSVKLMLKGASSGSSVIIGTMSDYADASTFTPVSTINNLGTTYGEYSVEIPAGTDQYFAIKHGLGSAYRLIYIDDICVMETPSCVKPINVDTSNVSHNSVDVTWATPLNPPANGYEYYYSTESTIPNANTVASGNVNTSSLNLTGLVGNTDYYLWVRSVCSGDDSSEWSLTNSFRTKCTPSVPNYSYTFDDGINVCWQMKSREDQSGTEILWRKDGFLNNGTTGAMVFNAFSKDRIGWLISPTFDLSGGGEYQLSFDYGLTKYNNANAGTLGSHDKIILKISEDNGVTWTDIQTWTSADNISNTSTTHTYTVTSTSSTVKFAFYATDGAIYDNDIDVEFFVDNFAIQDNALATQEVRVNDMKGVQLYPNPFQDIVYINDISGVEKITIIDMAGRVVKSFVPSKELNLKGLNSGMYLVNLSYKDGSIKTLKAIKK